MKPNKTLGQHFLEDQTVLDKIIQTANLTGDETVVEVGGGRGILTVALSDALPSGKVICLEFDQQLAYRLQEGIGKRKNISIVHVDALRFDWENLPKGYQIVANLPYQITSPLLNLWTFQLKNQPESMVIMVQKEVAERLTASPSKALPSGRHQPNSSDRGLTTILVELYGEAEYIETVPPEAFYPVPKVDSAILKITKDHSSQFTVHRGAIVAIAKAGFSNKRRTLSNSLAGSLHLPKSQVDDILNTVGIDPTRRAETLTIQEWSGLVGKIDSKFSK